MSIQQISLIILQSEGHNGSWSKMVVQKIKIQSIFITSCVLVTREKHYLCISYVGMLTLLSPTIG